jgi:signal transduction histidine kinase
MSHELRTPLNAIIGYGELLLEDKVKDSNDAKDLTHIIHSGKHLLELIDDILDLSKIEAGRVQLNLELIKVSELLDESCEIITPGLNKNNNLLSVDLCEFDLEVFADRTRLKQIILNLLSNANKFTHNGKIQISIYLEKSEEENPQAIISVKDSGIGIPEDQLHEIFNAFHQVGSNGKLQSGTGLGLTITRHFCEMMGGSISVSSAAGEGSTFTIRIPTGVCQVQNQVA